MTMGPSTDDVGVTAHAFPGLSIFIWVPTERKPPRACILTGLRPAAARPVVRLLPYLRRNPPGSQGSPNTGLPAIMSSMYVELGLIALCFRLAVASVSFLPLDARVSMKSHPSTPNLSVCFLILGAFRQSPSAITRSTPWRILDPCIFGTSLYPATSILSVPSPFTMTGHALTIISTSSGGGLY